jgi:hypothetical protein
MDIGAQAPAPAPARPKPAARPAPAPVLRRSPRKLATPVAPAAVRSPVKSPPTSSAKKSVTFDVEEDEALPTVDVGGFDEDMEEDVDVDVAMPEPEPVRAEEKKASTIRAKEDRPPEPESMLKTLDEEEDDEANEDLTTVTQDAAPVTFNGTELPKASDGSIPFFFMDAHEEKESPGTVFLFGRIPVSNQPGADTISACAAVQNMERCMYIVPTPSTFNDPDGSLEELGRQMETTRHEFKMCPANDAKKEEKQLAAKEAKKALMKALIPKSGELRAEVKEVLKKRGI